MLQRVLITGGLCLSLAGCDAVSKYMSKSESCLSSEGHEAVLNIVKEDVEKEIVGVVDDSEQFNHITPSSIRASLSQVKFLISDVRTTKSDPDSTKKFCAGTLMATFPLKAIEDADVTLELIEEPSVKKVVERYGHVKNADSISMKIDFTVQPTDDGGKIFSELENSDPIVEMVSTIIFGQLAKNTVQIAKQEAKDREAREQREIADAEMAQKTALLDEAKATNSLSEQGINAAWKALPEEVRQRALPLQRAWIKRKDAACTLEAANTSIEPMEKEAARLQCQARFNNSRADELTSLYNRVSSDYYSEY